jgi:hypothetical protein
MSKGGTRPPGASQGRTASEHCKSPLASAASRHLIRLMGPSVGSALALGPVTESRGPPRPGPHQRRPPRSPLPFPRPPIGTWARARPRCTTVSILAPARGTARSASLRTDVGLLVPILPRRSESSLPALSLSLVNQRNRSDRYRAAPAAPARPPRPLRAPPGPVRHGAAAGGPNRCKRAAFGVLTLACTAYVSARRVHTAAAILPVSLAR